MSDDVLPVAAAKAPDEGEASLLASLRSGSREAAERLAEQTYRPVYASLFRLCGGNADLAADLTQETYRKAWQSLDSFDARSKLFTWLYRIAYTTFLNHIRRPMRVVAIEESDPDAFTDPAERADDSVQRRQDEERVRRALLALPEELRFTVTAHYWGELPVSEIAELEHVTPVAIRKRLKRALAIVEAHLEVES